ncbi:MAG: hypothetical protein AB1586_25235 [Pseudomonadota bacterium]|jgi:hypothetical protein
MRTLLAAALLVGTALPALADAFNIVVPGRPGVPVLINGRDASYAVIEGEWGLGRGQAMQPIVYGGFRGPYVERPVGAYYPSAGRLPGYGRLEVEPPANRPLPPQAESYQKSWSAQSAPPQIQIPANPPPVIVAPQIGGGGPYPPGPPRPAPSR